MTTIERLDRPNAFQLAAVIGAVSVAMAGILSGTGLWHTAPWPFVFPELATLYFLCCLPVAASVWTITRGGIHGHLAVLMVSLLVLLFLPPFYGRVRIANQAQKAQEMVEESRFGEAQILLKQIVLLRPHATWQGVILGQASTRLEAIIEPIAASVAEPLPATADNEQRLTRARDLAMLGRTEEALQVLEAEAALANHPGALVLRGAIYEANRRWQTARDCYARAVSLLSDETTRTASAVFPTRAKALAGIGHCERKLGQLPQAEAAYTKLLDVAPTAETHFLVAQFYEDTQQSALAAAHARQAAELAPSAFQQRARQLEVRITTSHFSCLTAFWNLSTSNQGVGDRLPRQ